MRPITVFRLLAHGRDRVPPVLLTLRLSLLSLLLLFNLSSSFAEGVLHYSKQPVRAAAAAAAATPWRAALTQTQTKQLL